MRYKGVTIEGLGSDEQITLDTFSTAKLAGSDIGRLFLALLEEIVWSNAYDVYAYIHKEGYKGDDRLAVWHNAFFSNPLIIRPAGNITVEMVEGMVRSHIDACKKSHELSIHVLQKQCYLLDETAEKITADKAKAVGS